jgi:hypothetical protein
MANFSISGCMMMRTLCAGGDLDTNVHEGLWKDEMTARRLHSLRALPDYGAKEARQCQEYLIYGGPHSSTMAKFRMGDADMGNRRRGDAEADVCPACRSPPNIEGHLLFQCTALSDLRDGSGESVGLESFLANGGVKVQSAGKDGLSALVKAFLTGPVAQAKGTLNPQELAELDETRREGMRRKADFIHAMWQRWKDLVKEARGVAEQAQGRAPGEARRGDL